MWHVSKYGCFEFIDMYVCMYVCNIILVLALLRHIVRLTLDENPASQAMSCHLHTYIF